MNKKVLIATLALSATALTACSGMNAKPDAADAVKVPSGNVVAMRALGAGDLTYECRVKANSADAYEWTFAGPTAVLYDSQKNAVGKYYGGPTWEHNDGSKVTGKQLAVSPGSAGAIPLQLVQASPATGKGAMSGVTYIQRINTVGGVAPSGKPCGTSNAGAKELVKYQADYVFYKAGS